jgi:predicted ATP-binding protein involved in virulence
MTVAKLRIEFRGIRNGEFVFHQKTAIVGPNGCGKSTIVDALSLVLGKSRMVRNLTEHDFTGQLPDAERSIHDRGNDRRLLVGRPKRSSRLVPYGASDSEVDRR